VLRRIRPRNLCPPIVAVTGASVLRLRKTRAVQQQKTCSVAGPSNPALKRAVSVASKRETELKALRTVARMRNATAGGYACAVALAVNNPGATAAIEIVPWLCRPGRW